MAKVKGAGATLEFGDQATYTDSNVWTKIADVVDLKPPAIKSEDIDTSTLESEEQFDEYEAGWANGGEPEATVQFNADDADTMYGLFRQSKGFRITFANGSKWLVSGYINDFSQEVVRKGIISTKIKIKVSGKPLFVKA